MFAEEVAPDEETADKKVADKEKCTEHRSAHSCSRVCRPHSRNATLTLSIFVNMGRRSTHWDEGVARNRRTSSSERAGPRHIPSRNSHLGIVVGSRQSASRAQRNERRARLDRVRADNEAWRRRNGRGTRKERGLR